MMKKYEVKDSKKGLIFRRYKLHSSHAKFWLFILGHSLICGIPEQTLSHVCKYLMLTTYLVAIQ